MDENEKLIGKLIKKRKNENEAFTKLLDAIGNKQTAEVNPPKKPKRKTN